jgi:hypothetical protein
MSGMTFGIGVQAQGLDRIPTRSDDKWLDGQVKVAAEWVRSIWVAAVSGGVILPGMIQEVDDAEYARSLGMPSALRRTGRWEYTITAKYDVAGRIEQGFGSYDMKPMLLHGPHARIGAEGQRWNIVPFRFGTPILSGPNKGQARPHFGADNTMPVHVYKEVKGGDPYPETGEGQRSKIPFLFTEDELGGVNREAVIRDLPAPMVRPYTWRSGLYDSMRRYGSGRQVQYFTFRAVSEPRRIVKRWRGPGGIIVQRVTEKGSSPDSWIHPGQAANPVIAAVIDYTRPFVERMLLNAVDTLR